jgi:hypothetical protein
MKRKMKEEFSESFNNNNIIKKVKKEDDVTFNF